MKYSELALTLVLIFSITFACTNSEPSETIDDSVEKVLIEVDLTNVTPPFQAEKIPFQNVTISAEKDTLFVLNGGSFIDIPKDAFLQENGDMVEGNVAFSF
jgi:hypothetical protein